MKILCKLLTFLSINAILIAPATATADANHVTISPPFWTLQNTPPPPGSTKLVRTPNGVTAQFKTTGLTAGHAMTLWIMFFDNPDACNVPGACNPVGYHPEFSPDGDIGRPGVRFDFHYAGGHVVNNQKTTISGHLQVGELSTSGWAELAAIGAPIPTSVTALTNPLGAQVILAIHSHGPAQQGRTLNAQLSSYLGGCQLPFLGDAGGFAQFADDIPALPGECSTIQVAFHMPDN